MGIDNLGLAQVAWISAMACSLTALFVIASIFIALVCAGVFDDKR